AARARRNGRGRASRPGAGGQFLPPVRGHAVPLRRRGVRRLRDGRDPHWNGTRRPARLRADRLVAWPCAGPGRGVQRGVGHARRRGARRDRRRRGADRRNGRGDPPTGARRRAPAAEGGMTTKKPATGSPGPPDRSPSRISVEDFGYLQRVLEERSGIALDAGKEYLVETRLAALALQ